MTRYVIPHPMPTSEQRRDAIRDLIARGQPLGASHVPEIKGEVFANGSLVSRGEYRVTQETLDHYGPELLERINAMPLEDNRDRYGHLLDNSRSHAAKSASQGLIYGGTMKDSVVRDVWMHSKNYCARQGNRATENCLFLADGRSVGLDDRLPRNEEYSTNARAAFLRDRAALSRDRVVGKNPLLSHGYNHVPSRLSDGTDISRMTADEIAVHQRRLSPKYPTLREAAVLRRIRRRHFILSAFWVLAVISLFAWVLHVS